MCGLFALLVGSILARQLDCLGVSRRRFEIFGSAKVLVALLLELTDLRRETAGVFRHVLVYLRQWVCSTIKRGATR